LTLGVRCLRARRHHPLPHGTLSTLHAKQDSWIMKLPRLTATFPVTARLARYQCNLGRATLLTRDAFSAVVFLSMNVSRCEKKAK